MGYGMRLSLVRHLRVIESIYVKQTTNYIYYVYVNNIKIIT